jgi:CBS domain-containing protein
LLVDARPIHGDPGLPEVAKVFGEFRRHPATMGLLLTESLSHRPKNRSMRDILRGKGDTFNVKTSGLLPVVNIARWAALGVGSTELQTAQRLRAAAGSQILPTRQADRLIEVFELFQRLACAISSTRSRTESRPLTSSTVTSSHRSSAA